MKRISITLVRSCSWLARRVRGTPLDKVEIQLNMLQKRMGHAQMETTAIYANALRRAKKVGGI